jgi:hypothetical protein
MVVRNLYRIGVVPTPLEADPELIVDSDTVPSLPVSTQLFKSISWRNPQVFKRLGRIEHRELSSRDCGGRRTIGSSGAPDFRRLLVGESLDHCCL